MGDMEAVQKACKPLDPACLPIETALGTSPVDLRQEGRPALLLLGAFLGGIQYVFPFACACAPACAVAVRGSLCVCVWGGGGALARAF